MDCQVCHSKIFIPVLLCDHHSCCYECAWKTITQGPQCLREWANDYITFKTTCPFCRTAKLSIHIDGKVRVAGLRLLPEEMLQAVTPVKEGKCPFCSLEGTIVQLSKHVIACPAREFPCPRDSCSAMIQTGMGWEAHTYKECKWHICSRSPCSVRGTYEAMQIHDKTHELINQLRKRIYATWGFLASYSLQDEKLVEQFGAEVFQGRIQDFLNHFPTEDIIHNLFMFDRPCRPSRGSGSSSGSGPSHLLAP